MKNMSGRTARRRAAAYPSYASYNYESTARQPELREEQEEERRQRRTAARRTSARSERKARALEMDLPYLLVLTAATIISLCICCSYIRLQTSITSTMKLIEQKETELETLKTSNDALETDIKSQTDLNRIYEIATQQLGMVYADRNQVIRYKKSESEYVRQYEDIPGEAEN